MCELCPQVIVPQQNSPQIVPGLSHTELCYIYKDHPMDHSRISCIQLILEQEVIPPLVNPQWLVPGSSQVLRDFLLQETADKTLRTVAVFPRDVDPAESSRDLRSLRIRVGSVTAPTPAGPIQLMRVKDGKVDLAWARALGFAKVGCVRVLHQFWTAHGVGGPTLSD